LDWLQGFDIFRVLQNLRRLSDSARLDEKAALDSRADQVLLGEPELAHRRQVIQLIVEGFFKCPGIDFFEPPF
jgi:hypothetical protein